MLRRQLPYLAVALTACASPDDSAPTSPRILSSLTPGAAISDARSGGDSHFYWLPPIAPSAVYAGTFDTAASPELAICPWAGTSCSSPATTFTRTSSPAIAVSSTAQSFTFDWSTKPASITTGNYRAEVRLAGRLLGFADVRVVNSAKDLKSVPSGFVGVQDGKSLTFAFRIETGIVGSVAIAPRDDSVFIGDTVRFVATVRDVHGTVIIGAPVMWASRVLAVARIDAAGVVAPALSLGTTTIVATSGGVSDSTSLVVRQVPVARVVVSPSGTIPLTVGQQQAFTAATLDASGHTLSGRTVNWRANDTTVVKVGPDGLATAAGAGISFVVATSEGKRDSAFVDVTGATVTCLRPWAVPDVWFAPNVYGRAVTGRLGANFGSVIPTSTSGEYYPLQLGNTSSGTYSGNIPACSSFEVTLGVPTNLLFGNQVSTTVAGLDSLFKLDPDAVWDPSANGGLGGIAGSNAASGTESARVVKVGTYALSDNSAGSAAVRLRRVAYVFVESYVKTTGVPAGALRGDITFRFLRFGP